MITRILRGLHRYKSYYIISLILIFFILFINIYCESPKERFKEARFYKNLIAKMYGANSARENAKLLKDRPGIAE